jgi:DUF4097 and DUF4098 domain-containing protein YvlB
MSRRDVRFEVSGAPRIFMRLPTGNARLVSGEDGVVEVNLTGSESALSRYTVEERGGQIVVEPESGRMGRWSSVDIEIRVGADADVHARLGSADIAAEVTLGNFVVEAGAGDISAPNVSGDVRIKTAAGDVELGKVGGRLDIAAASGDIRVESVVRDVTVKTAAGDISIETADGSFLGHAASGDIHVSRFGGEVFQAKTLSGDVRVGVLPGRKLSVDFQSLSGDVRTEFPVTAGDTSDAVPGLISVKTMSGDVVVRAAD